MLERAANDNVPVLRWSQPDEFTFKSDAERRRTVDIWIGAVLVPALKRLSPDDPCSLGGDFARSGDVSGRWVWQTERNGHRHVALVIELRNIPFTEQEAIDAALIENLPRFQAAKYDATGNGAFLAERMQQRFGEDRVEAVKFTAAWYIEEFPRLRSALEDGTADLPDDGDIRADFRLVTLVNGVPKVPENKRTAEKGTKKGQRHGDTAIAAVLAYAASRAEPFAVGYETPSRKPRDRYEPRSDRQSLKMRADDDEDEFSAARKRATQ
jgi:phage FluMu gp28-like protein